MTLISPPKRQLHLFRLMVTSSIDSLDFVWTLLGARERWWFFTPWDPIFAKEAARIAGIAQHSWEIFEFLREIVDPKVAGAAIEGTTLAVCGFPKLVKTRSQEIRQEYTFRFGYFEKEDMEEHNGFIYYIGLVVTCETYQEELPICPRLPKRRERPASRRLRVFV